MRLILFISFVLLFNFGFSQNSSNGENYSLSNEDSIKLSDTWKEFLSIIKLEKEVSKEIIFDSLYCELCFSYREVGSKFMKPFEFESYGLKRFRTHSKIYQVITSETPSFHLVNYFINGQYKFNKTFPAWIVSFIYWKPNEYTEGHEGESISFEFMKIENEFKLFRIWTFP